MATNPWNYLIDYYFCLLLVRGNNYNISICRPGPTGLTTSATSERILPPPFMGVTLPGRDFKNNFDLISSFCEWQMIRSEPKQDKNKEMKKKLNIVETYVKH